MQYLLIINTTDAETVWNALRFGSSSLSRGHQVNVFLLGKAVEIDMPVAITRIERHIVSPKSEAAERVKADLAAAEAAGNGVDASE